MLNSKLNIGFKNSSTELVMITEKWTLPLKHPFKIKVTLTYVLLLLLFKCYNILNLFTSCFQIWLTSVSKNRKHIKK